MSYPYSAGDKVLATEYNEVVKAAGIYAADAGSTDSYAITVTPIPSAYSDGMTFRFKANTVNTGAATLNVNSLGAINILRADGTALTDGDIAANQLVEVTYRGGSFYLLSSVSQSSIVSLLPYPNGGFTSISTVILNSNTTAQVGNIIVSHKITVNKISLNVTAVSTTGTLKIAIFSQNGQTQYVSATTASISGTGIVSTTVTAFTLFPGIYYVVVLPVSTANITISAWLNVALAYSVTGSPLLSGTYTVTASTMPSTITPGSIGAAGGTGAVIRLDN